MDSFTAEQNTLTNPICKTCSPITNEHDTGANSLCLTLTDLPLSWSVEYLTQVVSVYGQTTSVDLALDNEGISRGYAFVNFVNHVSVAAALEALNGKVFVDEVSGTSHTLYVYQPDLSTNTYSFTDLKSINSNNNIKHININKKENYLSNIEFKTVFGMTKNEFYKTPLWKQNLIKKANGLF